MRFFNATIHALDKNCTTITDAELEFEDGIITYTGKTRKEKRGGTDCHGDILMPSFVNAHTHTAMTLFRSQGENLNLGDWLHKRIFPLEANLSEEDVYNGSMLGIAEYIKNGITTFADMYYFPHATAKAAQSVGVRAVITGSGSDLGSDAKKELEKCEESYLSIRGKYKNVFVMLGAHAEYTCSEKFLEGLTALAYKYKSPLYTHCSETLDEVGGCTIRNKNLTPPQFLHSLGFFDNGGVVAHGVHMDKDDIALLKQNDISVASCPASNLKLGSGIAPIYSMHKAGLNIALGTDGAASNNSLDMFREMYLLSTLQKAAMSDASLFPASRTLPMATKNGAKALGISNLGTLEAGSAADFIRIDASAVCMNPDPNNIEHILYSANPSCVKTTVSSGKILYDGGQFLTLDINEVIKNASASAKRLLKSL